MALVTTEYVFSHKKKRRTNMKRDERSLKWAKVNGYKYVECDDEGNIKGYGFSRQTLEYHNLSEYNVMTIRQYEKATKED